MNKADEKLKYLKVFRDNAEYFLVFSFLGWIYESIWCDMIYHRRGFLNRGVLFGPWLPIYGTGFFIILAIVRLLKLKKPPAVFAVGGAIATLAELIASYIMDIAVGGYTWDYTGYFLNYKGRIALVPGLMFGLLICLAVCVILPFLKKLREKFGSSKLHNILFILTASLFIADLISRIWLGSNFKGG